MSPEVARKLLVLVNNKPSMDALFEYAEESIRSHVKNLVREPDHNNVLKIQQTIWGFKKGKHIARNAFLHRTYQYD